MRQPVRTDLSDAWESNGLSSLDVLKGSSFGKRTAEEEQEHLRAYFVETEQWRQVFKGEVDIIYGPKGSGKSAIYSLISQSSNALFDRNIIVVPGENPQGAPAFKDVQDDPPSNEAEFINLWKLYVLTLCGIAFKEYGLTGPKCDLVVSTLEDADLIPTTISLAKVLRYAFDYVRKFTRPKVLETRVALDQITGMPIGLTGRIVFQEPSAAAAKCGILSIDELFVTASEALEASGYSIWIILDRLDVAFAESDELEARALRSLFRFYLETKVNKSISTKIFLRTDIWADITQGGFREASHIERSLSIEWRTEDLLNLVVRRAVSNEAICSFYGIERSQILADFGSQEQFLARMFPDQVETGPNKPRTLQWVLGRTRDAKQETAPRELIHFLNELRNVQINRLERGDSNITGEKLFEQIAFKEALPAVSKVRLEQTLYAEFPALKRYVEAMRDQKATQPLSNLQSIWNVSAQEAILVCAQLEQVGFLEKLGGQQGASWRVPFLYRPALSLIQGSADAPDGE